jgi:hypothetical protein
LNSISDNVKKQMKDRPLFAWLLWQPFITNRWILKIKLTCY